MCNLKIWKVFPDRSRKHKKRMSENIYSDKQRRKRDENMELLHVYTKD